MKDRLDINFDGIADTGGSTVVRNASAATIQGLELELDWVMDRCGPDAINRGLYPCLILINLKYLTPYLAISLTPMFLINLYRQRIPLSCLATALHECRTGN